MLAAISIGLFFTVVANAAPFQHPGTLHTQADFDRMVAKRTTEQPYINGYNVLASSPLSASGWNPRPLGTVIRGGPGDNVMQLSIDVARAYQCAMIWKISGSTDRVSGTPP